MGIRAKFSIFVSFLVLIVIGASLIAAYFIQRHLVLQQIDDKLQTQAKSFAAVCKESLLLNNEVMLLNYMKTVKSLEGIAYAYFAQEQGQILAHTKGELIYTSLEEWQKIRENGSREFREIVEVPRHNGHGGTHLAVVAFTEDYIDANVERVFAAFFRKSLVIAAVGLVLGLCCALILASFMSRPIQELAVGAREIGLGNLKYRVPVRSKDELALLASKFNEMALALSELDELKDHFIQMVSHDLRSPLAGARGYVQYLLDNEAGSLNAEQKELMATVDKSLDRLNNFITEILDLAKIEAGKMGYHIVPTPINWTIEEVAKLFRFNAEKKNIKLETRLPEKPPLALMDADRIFQVLTNLVSNALKFTEEGQIILAVNMNGSQVKVSVSDTGPGVAPEFLPRLFQKFQKAELFNKKGEKIKGTGLGLAICKGIVEAHQGRIWAESEMGKGTQMHFTLPLAGAVEAVQGQERKIDNPEFSKLIGESHG